MSRVSVIQSLVDCFDRPNYLEVGVEDGFTFHTIKAARKIAVDPVFRFEMPTTPITDSLEYHQIPSDDYFGARKATDPKFDVIFLDGLHTFEQILRDTLNAVESLAPNGVIVIDDVWPTSYAASLPSTDDMLRVREASPDGSVAWMGDVYRVVMFIDTFLQPFRFACTDKDPWQMVMWRGPRPAVEQRQVSDIAELSYAELLKHKSEMNFQPLSRIVADYRADHHNI
ncbi:Methyltransferase domain-containing protein [Sphingomonas sp. YR710]|uniref:class I SAM-dependent methyltransferase n=1 Tax=Sphingomonas sp. YR710 TaxID=1882773 RepID=UPI000884420F|nr:class I SAM-dependent methyltransferase [Sphingomonas sp. YR710]SDC06877.1 Methyltransferase domain-containing protein [Sphingomonas sp. YR710]